jgi:transcriptional antiterminator RfaH
LNAAVRRIRVLRWYLVHTKPSAEAVAQLNLERQGYETYLPRLLQRVLWRQQRRERVVPLFPRYLFLRLDSGRQTLSPVRSTAGVATVVRFGAEFAIVPDPVVGDLRSRADPATGLHRLSDAIKLVRGSAVQIVASAFDGLEGIFERTAGGDRVVVLLALLGRMTPVQVPVDTVLAARFA